MSNDMPSGENVGEIGQELSAIDLRIENLSFSARRCDSSFMDGSPASMVKADVSDVDHLHLDFDSINIVKSLDPRDSKTIVNSRADVLGSIDQADLPGQGYVQGEDTNKFDSTGLDHGATAESSAVRGPETEGFSRIDKSSRQPLIFYTSSRRKTHSIKLNKNNESPKPSTHGKLTSRNPVVDLSSLQILRKSRSSVSKRPRSSSWGYIGSTMLHSEENGTHSLNLSNEKKSRKVRGCKGKRNSFRAQICKESIGKSCAPTGRISLKIRIGNKLCGMVNATENFGSFGSLENNEEKSSGIMTASQERSSEKVSSDVDASGKLLNVKAVLDNSSFNTSSDFHHIISLEEGNPLTASIDNLCSDVGTSPDSEVINSVPDVPLCEKGLPDIQNCSVIPDACIPLSDISSPSLSLKKSNRGSKNGKLHQLGSCTLAIDPNGAGSLTNAKASLCVSDVSSLIMPQTESKKGKKVKLHKLADCGAKSKQTSTDAVNDANEPADHKADQNLSEAMIATPKPYLDNGEPNHCPLLASAMGSSYAEVCETICCSNGQKPSKYSGAKGGSKARIGGLSRKKDKSSKKKENKKTTGSKLQVSDNVCANGISRTESHYSAGNQKSSNLGEIRPSSNDLPAQESSQQFPSNEATELSTPLDDAWVLCDECEKWRRIPAALADRINETKCGWTCKENTDKKFAVCSIPQEKSDSDINDELGLPEDAGTGLKSTENLPKAVEQSSWSLIKSNLFLHRSRKKQTIDEVMVCHCKPPSDGRTGCGAKCLNRMLNIECVQGTCPCGELCSNQQFQKRNYAKLKWFKCGKKGYGLQALEDISRGQFLIEYVGEVLDVHAYEARQREYALNGHRHFYFMTLNGSEVIDACAKGNLGRFINHSCNPNCRTEKWMVNGEVCIGLFSLRDIKKGEEVTFDYNYVRVFGAAAKKCVCGSENCRGYIGGDPTNSEVIVQDDSDDEFSEPVMVCEDKELNEEWKDIMSCSVKKREKEIVNEPTENLYSSEKAINSSTVGEDAIDSHTLESLSPNVEGGRSAQFAETFTQNKCEVDHSVTKLLAVKSETNKISGGSLNGSLLPNSMVKDEDLHSQTLPSKRMDVSLRTDGSLNNEMFSAQGSTVTATSPSKSLSDTVESKRKLKCSIIGRNDEVAKSGSVVKTKNSPSLVRKTKVKTNVVKDKGTPDMDKLNAALHKSKKLTELSIKSHFEAVEEKLNELLDSEGGISKRKDASKGYLKLLFLTAASGNNGHGEAIQSNRELSMILDALLKTRSRSVLVDIINKNGLQMLHNIMKRYRKEFIKTPILRKLLKVLEHLALREILTLDHITGGPPCPGVESFRDSILILTEHTDKQVHQIARNFRDRWIPRSLRKTCCMDRDGGKSDFHQRSSHDGLPMSNERVGKPSEAANYAEKQTVDSLGTVETYPVDLSTNGAKTRKRKSRWDNPVSESPHSRTSLNLVGDKQLSIDEDVPPGFSSPCNNRVILPDTPAALTYPEIEMIETQHQSDVVFGDSQPRFVSRMPVSYGISKSFMQQFGVPKTEATYGWATVPGVPFHPFPPLPAHSRSSGDLPVSATRCALTSELSEKAEQHNDAFVVYPAGQKCSRTCSMELPNTNTSAANTLLDFQQGPSNSLGRKFFRQQKWNHSKLAPPWVRMRNGWGYPVNNPPNNPPGVGFGNGPNGFRNLYSSQEVNWRGEP